MFQKSKAFSSYSTNEFQKTKQFYETVLGLNVSVNDQMGVMNVHLANGELMIYPKTDHVPATFTVLNFLVDNIETAVEELRGRGVVFESYDQPKLKTDKSGIARQERGPAMAWFKDPGGNILAVLQERE
jgi:predicted enzyme related to lactoylglutathione lyase